MSWLRRHFDSCYIVGQVWLDGLSVLFSCILGHYAYVNFFHVDQSLGLYSRLFVVITAITLVSFWFSGLYRWRKSILNVEEYRSIYKATLLAFLLSCTAIFLLREVALDEKPWVPTHLIYRVLEPIHHLMELDAVDRYSRVMFFLVFFVIFSVTVIQRACMFSILNWLHRNHFGSHNVAIYGTAAAAIRLEQKLRLFPTLGYRLVGFISDDKSFEGVRLRDLPVLGTRDDIPQLKNDYQIDRVFVASPELEEGSLLELCGLLEKSGLQYQVVPRLFHFFSRRIAIDNLDSVPLITPLTDPVRPIYFMGKRILDLLVASLVLILSLPLVGVMALLIKRESPGPIFFRQTRIGKGGAPFSMIKFRTMYAEHCGDDISPDSKSDPRITRFGRFLRSTSLDELPQLWNVFRGKMTLVGPRPEMPFIVSKYEGAQALRLAVKPGITGLWQVSEARRSPIHENVDYDLYYIDNQSLFLDAVILALTVFAVFRVRTTH